MDLNARIRAAVRSRHVRNPATVTLAFVSSSLAVLLVLVWVTRSNARPDEGRELVRGGAFGTWTALAAIAVVAFGDSLVAGIRELLREPLRTSTPSPLFFVPYFVLLAVLVVGVLMSVNGGDLVPIHHWGLISRSLVVWGAVGAAPWVIAVWSMHAMLTEARASIGRLAPASVATGVDDLDEQLRMLRTFRKVIAKAVGRLLGIVLAAVLMSGALRVALVGGPLKEDDFPASAVLLYGAFFTGVLATAVVPLLVRWRELARRLVEQAYPLSATDTADQVAARQRMLGSLEVNGALFTFPVTLTALLAPLITSLLSVWVPQLSR